MVVGDPASELIELIRAGGDPAPCTAEPAAASSAALIRRRFSLSLPPPFVTMPEVQPDLGSSAVGSSPVRFAEPVDGAAIAAVKWRAFGTNYRGVLPDHFLDEREVVPPPGYWTGRALRPPSTSHRLLVWGEPGSVFGYLDLGPERDIPAPASIEREVTASGRSRSGEVYELYVDPCAQGHGVGAALLAAAEEELRELGFQRAVLSTVSTNSAARAFYGARGWVETGERHEVDLGVVAFEEVRLARELSALVRERRSFWDRLAE